MPIAVTAPPGRLRPLLTGLLVAALLVGTVGLLPGCTRPQSGLPDHGNRLQGSIASIADGDSFTLIDRDGRRVGIRIAGIDAPEKSQPHADTARDHLTQLLARGSIEVVP
ncbi:MAG: hypothetical protein NTV19_05890, partial [Burkholderiales bacterium]|nr:hypothetical protein [Burkholderiales bacterium]